MLTKRLAACAAQVTPAGVVCDVGTDHAYLPAELLQSGRCTRAVATDIHAGPLEAARRTLTEAGVLEQAELFLCDGLEQVQPAGITDVVIAGMGGETIADIIAAAPWLQSPSYQLVLQPMSCTDRLRRYLDQNGFEILRETAVYSQTRIYTVLHAEFTGKLPEKNAAFAYVGKLPQNGDALSKKLIEKQICTLQKCAAALKQVPQKQAQYQQIAKALDELEPLYR